MRPATTMRSGLVLGFGLLASACFMAVDPDALPPEEVADAADAGGDPIVPDTEGTDATCSDGRDNDHDGFYHCRGFDCCKGGIPAPGVTVCEAGSCKPIVPIAGVPPAPVPENTNAACSDGIDNDRDGFVDCIDWNCCKDGVPAAGVTVCAVGTCLPTFALACATDKDCSAGRVCDARDGQRACVKGCRDATLCAKGWQCVQAQCSASPCLGQCTPPTGTLVTIEEAVHHLGDGPGNEGTTFFKAFEVDETFSQASLELDFPGGPGPSLDRPPQVGINGYPAPSIVPFFPPLDPADPAWQTNPDGSHGYNAPFHVSLDVTGLLRPGTNTFLIWNGRYDDDFLFSNVQVWLR
jgi:hypothetical protein